MFCVEGTGTLSRFSFRHRPDMRERRVFASVSIDGTESLARVLEGPVPRWKLHPKFPGESGFGACWGLPRLREAVFDARFPFATVRMADDTLPLDVTLKAWSPFTPRDADNSSLPVASLEYRLTSRAQAPISAVFSFSAENILAQPMDFSAAAEQTPSDRIRPTPGGFILDGAGSTRRPWDKGQCAIWVDDPDVRVNHAWTLNSLDVEWRRFALGEYASRPPLTDASAAGASLFVPLSLAPTDARTIVVNVAWYVPHSDVYEPKQGLRDGKLINYSRPTGRYQPWYAGRFRAIGEVIEYWRAQYPALRQSTERFSRAFFDSSLPREAIEAVASNLSILKSPTVYRQIDGRIWGWEGSTPECDEGDTGISGTSTHVWNYAQSVPHLFPDLERGLRETEFLNNQSDEGLQYCRTPLPIRSVEPGHTFPDGPAADGQLGGIVKAYREWRISGDTEWVRRLWPRIRSSIEYCIRTWDPGHCGWLKEPHVTTYDTEFWGADSFCTSLYVGALQATVLIGRALGQEVAFYSALLHKAVHRIETQLFNGEYFFQNTEWRNLRAPFPPKNSVWRAFTPSDDWPALEKAEGPPGQCGTGCMSDGVMGIWLSRLSGLDLPVDSRKVTSHLLAVHRHNLRQELTTHTDFLRAFFACGPESGLVACSWPKGGRPSMPMIYSDEIWTGIEYQVASHLIAVGKVQEGLEIVRAVRRRYDGRVRNPFCEVEAGYWYARAMSSYALLQALSGARFDAVDKVLYLRPAIKGDFRSFLSTATGYGTVGVRDGRPFLEVASGTIPYSRIEYQPA